MKTRFFTSIAAPILSIALIFILISQTVFAQSDQMQIPETLTEQKVYIPYDKLETVLDNQEKGVFIPYSDFLKLWEKATRKKPEKKIPPPPVDAAIIHSQYTGTVEKDVIRFQGQLKISAIKEEWAKLLLDFTDIAIRKITIDGKPPLLNPVKKGLELIIPEKGEYLVNIDFAVKIESLPDKFISSFKLPSAPLIKMDLRFSDKDLDVRIEPMLSEKTGSSEDHSLISAFLPPQGKVQVSWLAKSEKKTAQALIFAKTSSMLKIEESVYSIDTDIQFSVIQAKTGNFNVQLPEGLSIVNVKGENIRQWDTDDNGMLLVTLFKKIEGNYKLSLKTELYRDPAQKKFAYPAIKIPDAKREEGIIAVNAAPSLKVKMEGTSKVTQVDSDDNQLFAFQYFRHPFELKFSISEIKPEIRAYIKTRVHIGEHIIAVNSEILYNIKGAGVFFLDLIIPETFSVSDVGNQKTVESYSISKTEGKRVMHVVLKARAFGKFALPVHMEKPRSSDDLSFQLPQISCMNIQREEGIIALSLRKNLKMSTRDTKGLVPVNPRSLQNAGFSPESRLSELVAGYRFTGNEYGATLDIEKRKTRVTAAVERGVIIEETGITTTDIIRYNILFAPIRTLKIEVPADLGKDARIFGKNIKEKRFNIEKKDSGKKDIGIWEIDLHSPVMDNYSFSIKMEKRFDEIQATQTRELDMPMIRVLDVFYESGHISISKSPNLQVEPEQLLNLKPVDTKELPAAMKRVSSALAFKYLSHPYSIKFRATRHDYEKVLNGVVTHAHFDIVASKEGIAKTESIFRIKHSNRQSVEIKMPENHTRTYAVFISGKKASISKGSDKFTKILMFPKNIKPGKEFTVRMIYESELKKDLGKAGLFRVEAAEIKDIPILKISWRLYLPRGFSYLHMDGSVHSDRAWFTLFDDINTGIMSSNVYARKSVQTNYNKIPAQNDEAGLAGLDVELVREGRLYYFSKLDKDAWLNILYVKRSLLFKIGVVFFAVFTALFIYLPTKITVKNTVFFAILIAVAFFVKIFVPQGFKLIIWWIIWAAFLSAAFYFVRHTHQVLRFKWPFKRIFASTIDEKPRKESTLIVSARPKPYKSTPGESTPGESTPGEEKTDTKDSRKQEEKPDKGEDK
ncbi:hypothetical protein QUF76_03200 [Desulfobacterales bacterium HSG16]|nr:hypothetical protein [Desulfobacterales bacterium HSG16]